MKTLPLKAIAALGCAAITLAALTGCGPTDASAPATPTSLPSTTTGTTGTTSATGATSSPGQGSPTPGAPVVLDEQADHTRVTVAPGTTVRVDLHSTYWSPATSSDPNLLSLVGSPSTASSPSCRPGSGCGTVTTTFVARAAGSARLTAQRTSCGEAKPCPPDQQTFTVDVDITP